MHRALSNPFVVLGLVALFWGGNAVAGKLAVGHISPMLLTLTRWSCAVLVLTPFALAHARRDWPLIRPRLPLLFCLGALGFATFNATYYFALHYTTAINVTIEQSAMPLVVFAANFALFRTAVTRFQILGFALTLVGVALTASHGELATLIALDLNRGDALMLFAVVIYAGYTVALKYKPQIHWLSLIYVLAVSALLTSVPFAAIEWRSGNTLPPDAQGLAVAAFTAIFPSILAQSLYIRGVEMIGPNRANIFINLVPIFGAVLAVLILGEDLFPYHVVALAFVLGGITLAERASFGRRGEAVASPESGTN